MISNNIIAFDLGSSRISAMAAEVQADDTLKILAEESKPSEDIRYGIVEQVSGAAFKINELNKLLQNSAKIPEIKKISLSVGGKSMTQVPVSVSRVVENSNTISESLLADMMDESQRKSQKQDTTIFDSIPVSYIVDGERMDEPVGQAGMQITANYQVVMANSSVKDGIDRCLDRTGIIDERVWIAVEAISAAVLEEEDREEGCALINFGANTTTLAIYEEGVLQKLLVIPLGGKNITRDIQELGISEEHAEKLKCIKGSALEALVENPVNIQIPSIEDPNSQIKISTKFLAMIIEARTEEILEPIFSTMESYPADLKAGIIITGGASKLNNLVEFIDQRTGQPTRYGDHSAWLAEGTDEKYLDPVYSQIIGTIVLTHDWRKENPEVEVLTVKEPKIKKPGIKTRIATGFIDFFGDDNKMN